MFGVPAITWFRRWTLSPAIQSYAILIIPAVVGWIWIARRRLVVPEIESIIRKQDTCLRETARIHSQRNWRPREIGTRCRFLEQPPILDVRSGTMLNFRAGIGRDCILVARPILNMPWVCSDMCGNCTVSSWKVYIQGRSVSLSIHVHHDSGARSLA